jgi:hypothetical protein
MYGASRFKCPVEAERVKLVAEAQSLVQQAKLLIPGLWHAPLSKRGKLTESAMKEMANMMINRRAFRE